MNRLVDERQPISRRLKDALVADLALVDLGADGDFWINNRLRDAEDWTFHLGRQLGLRPTEHGGTHETLLIVVWQLDEALRQWPPSHDISACKLIARDATKDLSSVEILATLAAGPATWRDLAISCKVKNFAREMQPHLEKSLATELHRLLTRWVEWDIRRLREHRRVALDLAAKPVQEPAKQPETRQRFQRPSGRDQINRLTPRFQPPGRT